MKQEELDDRDDEKLSEVPAPNVKPKLKEKKLKKKKDTAPNVKPEHKRQKKKDTAPNVKPEGSTNEAKVKPSYNRLRQFPVYERDVAKVIKFLHSESKILDNDLPNIQWVPGSVLKTNVQLKKKAGPKGAHTLWAQPQNSTEWLLVVPMENQENWLRNQMLSSESTMPLTRDSGYHWLKKTTANISRRAFWKFLEKQSVLQVTRNIPNERKKGGQQRNVKGHLEMDLMHINKETLAEIGPAVGTEVTEEQKAEAVRTSKPAYFLALVDQMTGYGLVALCTEKTTSVVRLRLRALLRKMETDLGGPVLSVGSDHGKEFSAHVKDLFDRWDPPIKQHLVQRASRVEKFNSDYQRSFYRLVRLKRGGLKSCLAQAVKLTNELLSKNLHMTPAEAVKAPEAEVAKLFNATGKRDPQHKKPYKPKKIPKIGDKVRYLVKMRKNIRTLGYKTYKGKHLSSRVFTIRNITKNPPYQYYVAGAWKDRDEIVLVSGTDAVTEARLEG